MSQGRGLLPTGSVAGVERGRLLASWLFQTVFCFVLPPSVAKARRSDAGSRQGISDLFVLNINHSSSSRLHRRTALKTAEFENHSADEYTPHQRIHTHMDMTPGIHLYSSALTIPYII